MGLFYGAGSLSEFFSNPASWWDHFKNGMTNDVNLAVANQNLDYQKERARIEDNRYAEETEYNRAFAEDERAYNRAFAEDERAYNRALQQQIFNREDTAIERQAEQLSAMGINPLSQQMNGLGAGSVVGSSMPSPSPMPSASGRSASPLHNDFKMTDMGVMPLLSALGGLADVVNGMSTGTYQRDALALENDRKFLENFDYANKLGINYSPSSKLGNRSTWKTGYQFIDENNGKLVFNKPYFEYSRKANSGKALNEYENEKYKYNHDIHDSSNPKINFLNELATMDFPDIASKLMTNIANTGNFVGEQFKKDFGDNSPFMKFFSKFF